MLRYFKSFSCLLILIAGVFVAGLQQSRGFTLLGAFDNWQLPEVGFGFGELGGSKIHGEEFRLNTPVITYGFDHTFINFFGPEGIKAVDQAFAILNKIPPASRMSTNLVEFLTDDAQRTLPSAEALNLRDLKSATLGLLIEHMGLAGEEHVFDLRKRITLPGGACQFDYQVQLRNFDPVPNVLIPPFTRFVNGTLYGYEIVDSCPAASIAFAEERLVDPTDLPATAVASFKGAGLYPGQRLGGYYIGITRDDAGGLRYMYRRDNYNVGESLPPDARALQVAGPWQPINPGTNNISTNTAAVRGGINKVTFRKVRFSPIGGSFFRPMVQTYKSSVRTNDFDGDEKTIQQTVRRLVSQPDILFTAADLNNLPPANPSLGPSIAARSIAFVTNDTPIFSAPESVGPGVILPQTLITFHKATPHFFNTTDFFLDDITAEPGFLWASFDGSTNEPVIYGLQAQGLTLRDIERRALAPIPQQP